MLFFHLALPEKATHIRHYFCHVAFSTSRNPNKQHDAPYTPLYVAFTIFMLLKRQHVTAFVMLLLLLPPMRARTLLARHFSEDSCSLYLPQRFRLLWRGISRKILAPFTSHKGSAPSGEAFLDNLGFVEVAPFAKSGKKNAWNSGKSKIVNPAVENRADRGFMTAGNQKL